MCMGMEILGAMLSIAQAGMSFAAASQQAAAQNAAAERNRLNAIAAANDRYAALNTNTVQHREAASQELLQKQTEALKARATAAVSAGENGVTGLSVDALLRDFEAQEFRQRQAIGTNFDIKKQHNADEMDATYHQAVNRINSVRQATSPNPAAYILQGIGGAMGAFNKNGGFAFG